MKWLVLILVLLFGCQQAKESMVVGTWNLVKVENTKTNLYDTNILCEGVFWVFDNDSLFTMETKWQAFSTTKYFINEDELSAFDIDTAVYQIEKNIKDELNWLILKQDTLRFYLKKAKPL